MSEPSQRTWPFYVADMIASAEKVTVISMFITNETYVMYRAVYC